MIEMAIYPAAREIGGKKIQFTAEAISVKIAICSSRHQMVYCIEFTDVDRIYF